MSKAGMPGGCSDALFIQFAKEPRPGQVKTRMQPQLNAEQACSLHCDLLQWTCRALCDGGLADVELWVSGAHTHPVFAHCLTMGVKRLHQQQGCDLGERMFHAISHGLTRYRKVILVGSDCPSIDSAYLHDALEALESNPLVLGPATDGGYVLIGATRIQAALFQGVFWGEAQVFRDTVARVTELGEGWSELPLLSDIDRPEDIPLWEALQAPAG